jgi:hypothetical protein
MTPFLCDLRRDPNQQLQLIWESMLPSSHIKDNSQLLMGLKQVVFYLEVEVINKIEQVHALRIVPYYHSLKHYV